MLLCIPFVSNSVWAAVAHGSIKGTGVTMYAQGATGGNVATPNTAATLDYKLVTKGSKSWAYLKFNGTSGINAGAAWQTQLRYWSSTNAKTENNLTDVKNATAKTVLGSTTKTIPNPLKISLFQDLATGGFSETLLIPYDVSAQNSPVAGDATVPTISACEVSAIAETSAALTFTGADNSGDVYFHIADAAHGVEEFALSNTITLTGLTASTNYNLTITPIDFNGNEGTPLTKSFTTIGLVQVTYGIAKDIKFMLKSSATQLEYYYEPVDGSKKLRDAFVKITPSGGTEFEIKPTLSPDSTYAYGVTTDANIANKILSLNCGYWIAPGLPDYSDYVMTNASVTSGSQNGTLIKHQMGAAIASALAETTLPVLDAVNLVDVNSGYAKLNIAGSDNSGAVYYSITGAKQDVNAFKTGDYYLTAIEPGKVYTLNITANDFSGNKSEVKTQKVKTMNARTNLLDGNLMKYNSTLIASTGATNELAANIQVSGNTLAIGCNTTNTGLATAQLNRKFYNASVKINGTSYPLTLSTPDSTLAQAVFTDQVGTTPISTGTPFTVQFSVFWTKGAGNFFTGTFTYSIGDNGQVDTEGPSTPGLHLSGNNLTWNASIDALSGVKWYLVAEAGQPVKKIFDLGETSFSYTMANSANTVEVSAVDFVGNVTKTSQILSAITNVKMDQTAVYPNPAKDMVYFKNNVAEAVIYSLQGQRLLSGKHVNCMNVSSLKSGMYIIYLTDNDGNQKSAKIEIQ